MIRKIKFVSVFLFAGFTIALIVCSYIGLKAVFTDGLLFSIRTLGAAALAALFTETGCIFIELHRKNSASLQKNLSPGTGAK